jgi:ABC-type antimicrobial peptide transport system permease subunit
LPHRPRIPRLQLAAVGIVVGAIAGLVLTRAMTSMLIGIQPNDPLTFGGMAALFLAISTFATWMPARTAPRR